MPSRRVFEDAYRQYADRIFRYLLWRTSDRLLAEDLTSETFVRAWERWPRFDGAHPQAWLYRIARNLLIDLWRKKEPRRFSLEGELIETLPAEEEVINFDKERERAVIQQAVDQLAEPLQTVIILRFMEEYPVEAVADGDRLDCIPASAGQHWHGGGSRAEFAQRIPLSSEAGQ